jgi:hypothetical protein
VIPRRAGPARRPKARSLPAPRPLEPRSRSGPCPWLELTCATQGRPGPQPAVVAAAGVRSLVRQRGSHAAWSSIWPLRDETWPLRDETWPSRGEISVRGGALRPRALCRPWRVGTPRRSLRVGTPRRSLRPWLPGGLRAARRRPRWPASGCAGAGGCGVARRGPWRGDRRSSSAHDRARRRSVRLGRSRTMGRRATRPANAGPACDSARERWAAPDSAALWRAVNDDPARCGENFGRNLKRLGSFEVVDKTLNVRTRTGRDIARRSIEKRTSSGLDFRKDSIYTSWQCFTGGCAPLGCRPPFAP